MVKTRRLPLQEQINTDGQWEKMIQKEGLIVADIYSDWCGPCVAMIPNLRRIKREIGIHLVIAKSDNISYLEQFRNKSEPTWIILVNGKIVNIMYGANAPKLTRLITDELKKEVAVKAGISERIELEISDLPKEEEVVIELIEETPKVDELTNVTVSDQEYTYRPF